MEKSMLVLEESRDGKTIVRKPNMVTIGKLISALEQYDDDTPVYINHDNDYIYVGIPVGKLKEKSE
jgi:hypothetical protein